MSGLAWAEADQFRHDYCDAEGHDRQAILVRDHAHTTFCNGYHPDCPAPGASVLGGPEMTVAGNDDDVMDELRREIQQIDQELVPVEPTPCGICGCVIGAGLMQLHIDDQHPPAPDRTPGSKRGVYGPRHP